MKTLKYVYYKLKNFTNTIQHEITKLIITDIKFKKITSLKLTFITALINQNFSKLAELKFNFFYFILN